MNICSCIFVYKVYAYTSYIHVFLKHFKITGCLLKLGYQFLNLKMYLCSADAKQIIATTVLRFVTEKLLQITLDYVNLGFKMSCYYMLFQRRIFALFPKVMLQSPF